VGTAGLSGAGGPPWVDQGTHPGNGDADEGERIAMIPGTRPKPKDEILDARQAEQIQDHIAPRD
jgi:hypothetical protein